MIQLLTLLLVIGSVDAPAPGEALYLSGVGLRSAGDMDGAVGRFAEVVEGDPDSPFAASSLLLWAEVEQDRGADETAADLYRQLLTDYPTHRLARTATTRLDAIERRATLDPVEARYEDLLASYSESGAYETRAGVLALVDDNAGHAIVPAAECWLGYQERQATRFDESIEHYRRSLAADPQSDCARRALDHIGNVALDQGDLSTAREAFEALADHGESGAAASSFHMANLRRAETVRTVWRVMWIGSVLAGLLLLVGLPWSDLRRRHLGTATIVGIVMAVALFVVGAFGGSPLRTLLLLTALLVAPIAGVAGALLRLPTRRWYRVGWPIATTWLVVAAVYGSLYTLDRF